MSQGCAGRAITPGILGSLNEDPSTNIKEVIASYVLLRTYTEFKPQNESLFERVYAENGGIGIVYGGFVLTVDHVVSSWSVHVDTPYGSATIPTKEKINEKTYLGNIPLEEIVNNKVYDVAVFRAPSDFHGQKYPFELGDSSKLDYGHPIFLIGNPRLQGYNVREGIVSSPVRIIDGREGFFISAPVTAGDSGTAVVDRRTFELLGLCSQKDRDTTTGIVIPINPFKPYLRRQVA